MQKGTDNKEVKKAIDKRKCSTAIGVERITAEMVKYGRETVVEWM